MERIIDFILNNIPHGSKDNFLEKTQALVEKQGMSRKFLFLFRLKPF